jgi:hypothetical protein
MVYFWNKLGSLLLGLLLGVLSGWASSVSLTYSQLLFRPPLIFIVFVAALLALYLGATIRILVGSISLLCIYWLIFLCGPAISISGTVGGLLTVLLLERLVPIRKPIALFVGVILFSIVSILIDVNAEAVQLYLKELSPLDPSGDWVRSIWQLGIFLWQTIMMAAIALQLYTERQYRQRLAAQTIDEEAPPMS